MDGTDSSSSALQSRFHSNPRFSMHFDLGQQQPSTLIRALAGVMDFGGRPPLVVCLLTGVDCDDDAFSRLHVGYPHMAKGGWKVIAKGVMPSSLSTVPRSIDPQTLYGWFYGLLFRRISENHR